MELFGYDELRAEQARAARAAATRCSSASASPRSPRCAGWPRPGCSARWPTARAAGSTPSIRMLPTGKVEVVTGSSRARPGPRDGVEPDRRRPARRAVRGRRGAARRHPDLAQGHGHLRLPLAGRRRHGRWSRRCDKVVEKAKRDRRAPAGGRRADDLEFADGRVLGPRRPGRGARRIAGDRAGHVRRARPARRRRADARRRRHLRPGQLLLPARHPPVRDRGRHRDRASSRSARTWPSTTSARWSTR